LEGIRDDPSCQGAPGLSPAIPIINPGLVVVQKYNIVRQRYIVTRVKITRLESRFLVTRLESRWETMLWWLHSSHFFTEWLDSSHNQWLEVIFTKSTNILVSPTCIRLPIVCPGIKLIIISFQDACYPQIRGIYNPEKHFLVKIVLVEQVRALFVLRFMFIVMIHISYNYLRMTPSI